MSAPKGNKYAEGNKGGRPPIHTDPNVVDELIEDYFVYIQGEEGEKEQEFPVYESLASGEKIQVGVEKKTVTYWVRQPEPPTVTGLTLHLGFSHKSSLYEYADKQEFTDSIKKGLTKIEQFHEIKTSQGDKCTGNIFVLKNFGWRDSSVVDVTTGGEKLNTKQGIDLSNATPEELAIIAKITRVKETD